MMKEKGSIAFDLKWAQTLDGQLADDQSISKWISCNEELVETHRIRKYYDGVLVGGKTFLKDLSKLTIREVPMGKYDKHPVRIVLDPRGRVSEALEQENDEARMLKGELLSNTLRPTLILSPEAKVLSEVVKEGGSNLIHIPFSADLASPDFPMHLSASLKSATSFLSQPIETVLVEGGASVLKFFIESAYFRKLIITVSPKMTGGYKNRVFLNRSLQDAFQLSLTEVRMVGEDLIMDYESKKSDYLKSFSGKSSFDKGSANVQM